jgi:hypothetical protein
MLETLLVRRNNHLRFKIPFLTEDRSDFTYLPLQKYLNLKSCLLKCYLIAGISQKPIVKQSLDEGSLRCTVLYGRIPREKNLDKNYGNSATSTYA